MSVIYAVGLFCCEKFEETPNEKVINMWKLTKPYFSNLPGPIIKCKKYTRLNFTKPDG